MRITSLHYMTCITLYVLVTFIIIFFYGDVERRNHIHLLQVATFGRRINSKILFVQKLNVFLFFINNNTKNKRKYSIQKTRKPENQKTQKCLEYAAQDVVKKDIIDAI
jgi:hypothetical protein